MQLGGREVDPHDERTPLGVRGGPLGRLTARLGADPFPDRADEPGVLGDLEERARREQPLRRVRPPQQRLEAGQRVASRARRPAGSAVRTLRRRPPAAARDSMSSRVTTRSRSSSSKTSARARPRSLAQYIAASASRSTSSGGLSPIIVIPMLAVTTTSFPPIVNGACTISSTRFASVYASNSRPDLLADHHELVAAEPCDEVAGAQRDAQARTHLDEERVTGIVARRCR